MKGSDGEVPLAVPRDRDGSFEPELVKKGQIRIDGIDDKIIGLYAAGLSVRDIQAHLEELYGLRVSSDLISRVTDAVLDEVREWQHRALDRIYPIVIFDALRVKIRDADSRMVKNKAVYISLGVTRKGEREVLGLWIADNEGAKFWVSVMNELRNRGVQDILIAVVDGLQGFPEAITAAFPETMIQTCIVHLIRHSMNFCSWKDRKAVAVDLRPIYAAPTAEEAARQLDVFEEKMGRKIPVHRPGLAQGMGRGHPILRLQRRDPEDHLHHECRGGVEPGASEDAEDQGLVPNRGGRHEADLLGHPLLREGRPRRPGMGCGPQSTGHNIRSAFRCLTVSENRMSQIRYKED